MHWVLNNEDTLKILVGNTILLGSLIWSLFFILIKSTEAGDIFWSSIISLLTTFGICIVLYIVAILVSEIDLEDY